MMAEEEGKGKDLPSQERYERRDLCRLGGGNGDWEIWLGLGFCDTPCETLQQAGASQLLHCNTLNRPPHVHQHPIDVFVSLCI